MASNKNTKGFRRYPYNVLGNADQEDLSISVDTLGLHEIKVFNYILDELWNTLNMISQSSSEYELVRYGSSLYIVLMRAESIWQGIAQSAALKARDLKMTETKHFKYDATFAKSADSLDNYLNFYKNPHSFVNEYEDNTDGEFSRFYGMQDAQKLEYIKEKITDIIFNADKDWELYANQIGLGMPLKIHEQRQLFSRTNKVNPMEAK